MFPQNSQTHPLGNHCAPPLPLPYIFVHYYILYRIKWITNWITWEILLHFYFIYILLSTFYVFLESLIYCFNLFNVFWMYLFVFDCWFYFITTFLFPVDKGGHLKLANAELASTVSYTKLGRAQPHLVFVFSVLFMQTICF